MLLPTQYPSKPEKMLNMPFDKIFFRVLYYMALLSLFFLMVKQILVTSKRRASQAEFSCFQLVQNEGCRKRNPLGFPPIKQLSHICLHALCQFFFLLALDERIEVKLRPSKREFGES